MKIGKIISGGLFVGLILASNIISIPAKATPLEPDWMNGVVTYSLLGKSAPLAGKCTFESRKIKPAGLRVYDESDPNTTKPLCVYKANGFEYAYYQRAFLINPTLPNAGVIYEKGVAFSVDDVSDMIPSRLSGDDLDRLYAGSSSDVFIYQERNVNYSLTLRLYHNPLMHMHINSDGFLEFNLHDNGYFYLRDDQGRELSALGGSVSSNGKYLSLVISEHGLARISLDDAQLKLVTNRFNISGVYPLPTPSTSINANGSRVIVGGSNIETSIYDTTSSCGASFKDTIPSTQDDKFVVCPSRNLDSLTQSIGAANSRNGYPELVKITLNDQGDSFVYTDEVDWYAVFAPNYIAPDSMDYLALGDSYSSGEGDIDQTGSTHYLSFTNAIGNYSTGIPRELCHVSDRSYPFLLAADMQIGRGNDMQSVACSGAKRGDVLTIGSLVRDMSYMGQSTPLYDSSLLHSYSGARLSGLSNAAALQDEALQKFIPGRIQQVEMVRKYQPKVATIGVSGNDLDFAPILLSCLTNFPTGDCSYATGDGLAELGKAIQGNYDKQVAFYNDLRQASPGTDFYAVGYPQFISDKSAYCVELGGLLSANERSMIRSAVTYLNQTIKNAASTAGIKYINIENVITSQSQDMCAESGMITGATDKFYYGVLTAMYRNALPTKENASALEEYIMSGVAGSDLSRVITSPATSLRIFMQEAFHPNAEGHKAIYDYIHKNQNGASLLDDTCDGVVIVCPVQKNSYEPAMPASFGSSDLNVEFTKLLRTDTATGKEYIQISGMSEVERGRAVDVYMKEAKYDPGMPVKVELHSDPRLLASTTAGADGVVSVGVTIPVDTPVGYHEISVSGIGLDGRVMKYIEPVFVTGPSDDIDGDGIANNVDTCEFIAPSEIDTDDDGIDDNCDLKSQILKPTSASIDSSTYLARGRGIENEAISWLPYGYAENSRVLNNLKIQSSNGVGDVKSNIIDGVSGNLLMLLVIMICLILMHARQRKKI